MEIAKFEKIKTWLPSKMVLAQGHVLGNANFDSRDDIHVFTLTRSFFPRFQKLAFCEERQCQDKFFSGLSLPKLMKLLMLTTFKYNQQFRSFG